MRKKKMGFTLIELIAVLVIMTILALIVTPLVLNIIRKARISADKRSIDAYGRSIELAIASYLLDTGKFPTSIDQLTIEYSGDEVVCSTTQLNSDSSVYLTGCTVAGRSVGDYAYGKLQVVTYDAYSVGDEVTYNGVDYYVIADSGENQANVTMLKKTPLTVSEVNTYGGVGTANNHVNMYVTSDTSASYYQTAYDSNGYGGMAYYSSSTCGYGTYTGCTSNYADSEVKYVVDAWKTAKAPAATEARLITYEELLANLGYENSVTCTGGCFYSGSLDNVPTWVYNNSYWYWTMSQNGDQASLVWYVYNDGGLRGHYVDGVSNSYDGIVVRPVITISKSEL